MMDGRGGEGRSDLPIRNENYGLDYQAYIGEQPSVVIPIHSTKSNLNTCSIKFVKEIEFPNTDAGLRSVLEQHGCFETPVGSLNTRNKLKCIGTCVLRKV